MSPLKVILSLCFFTFVAVCAANSETIVLAAPTYPPLIFDAPDAHGKNGFVVDIEKYIFEQAGYQVEFKSMPFVRSIKEVEKKRIDGTVAANTSHSTKVLLSKTPVATLNQTFYVRHDDPWVYNGIDSLTHRRVATILGYNYSPMSSAYQDYLENKKNNVKVMTGNTADQRIFRMIDIHRLDVFNESEARADYLLSTTLKTVKLKKAGSLGDPIYLYFSAADTPKGKTLITVFDRGMKSLVESGKINALLLPYGMKK